MQMQLQYFRVCFESHHLSSVGTQEKIDEYGIRDKQEID